MFHHCLVLVPIFFLSNLLSKNSKRFCSVTAIAHVSQPYVAVGLMIDLFPDKTIMNKMCIKNKANIFFQLKVTPKLSSGGMGFLILVS